MNNTNLPIERKNSIFSKIANFFKSIFYRPENAEEIQSDFKNQIIEKNAKNDFTENLRISSINEDIKLQQDYKSGIIKEEDLTKEQYNRLIKLYDKQIENYKTNISMKKEQLRSYKQKITDMRKKLA